MHYWYDFFRDQGSLIAGVFALIVGYLLYSVGERQVRATTTAETNANTAAAEALIREVIECNKLVIEALRVCGYILWEATDDETEYIIDHDDPGPGSV